MPPLSLDLQTPYSYLGLTHLYFLGHHNEDQALLLSIVIISNSKYVKHMPR